MFLFDTYIVLKTIIQLFVIYYPLAIVKQNRLEEVTVAALSTQVE